MNDNKIEIVLLTTNKTGVLSSMILACGKLGLSCRRNQSEKIDDSKSKLSIAFEGSLNCSMDEFINTIESHSEVHSIENLSIGGSQGSNSAQPSSSPNNSAPNTASSTTSKAASSSGSVKLSAHDIITPQALKVAEDRLVNILGPVAPILIESAAAKTKHIGDLFFMLSAELEGEEKEDFLNLVDDLDLNLLKR